MPYIEPARRKLLEPAIKRLLNALCDNSVTAGDINYVITRILWTMYPDIGYDIMNTGLGIIEAVKLEYARRLLAPYEEKKRDVNGDISVAL